MPFAIGMVHAVSIFRAADCVGLGLNSADHLAGHVGYKGAATCSKPSPMNKTLRTALMTGLERVKCGSRGTRIYPILLVANALGDILSP